MKIKHWMVAAAAVALAAAARGEYLYWQVDNVSAADATVATLYYSVNGGAPYTVDADGWSGLGTSGETAIGPYQANLSSLSGDLSDYAFYVEVVQYTSSGGTYTADPASARTSYTWKYTDLVAQGHILADSVLAPTALALTPVNFSTPAPEPTGGLLIVIGAAALALRRRRAVA